MKKIINNRLSVILVLLVTICAGTFFQACEGNEEEMLMPEVSYIRITAPAKSDSLVAHAYMGNNIAIIGQNLGHVDEIWFNDQLAALNPNLVTNSSIIVQVPQVIPTTVTNLMYLINSNKVDTLRYSFGVDVPAPQLDRLVCEYVETGGTAVIQGNYFVDNPGTPLQVFFPGNIEGTVKSISIDEVEVTVPEGVGAGPIQVKTIYGSTRSSFYFRDDRNMVVNFDNLTAAGGWRSGIIGNSDPAPVSGNYVRFRGSLPAGDPINWPWADEDHFSFNMWPQANGRADAPFYTGEIKDALVKFEVNVLDPWESCALQMIFTPYSVTGTNSYIADLTFPRGLWIPWKGTGTYKTNGWTTVTLPLSDFIYTPGGAVCANAFTNDMLRGLTFVVYNGGVVGTACNPHICIDNIRVVPK